MTIKRDPPAAVGRLEMALNVGDLNTEEKRLLWNHLAQNFPQYAVELKNTLRTDGVSSVIEAFGASPIIPETYVPQSLRGKLYRW